MGLLGDTPSYNIDEGMNAVNRAKQQNTALVNNSTSLLQALNKPYQSDVTATGQQYQKSGNAIGQNYLNSTANAADQIGTNLSQALQRSTMAAQPALQNSLREQMAAGGGLARGAYDQGVMQLGQQASNQMYEGNQNILNNQLQARENALGSVYGNDMSMNGALMGNDLGAMGNVYNNNRADISGQSAQLQGINNEATNNALALYGVQQNSNIAGQAANNAANGNLLSSLLGTAGTVVGGVYGGPAGAAAGGAAGNAAGRGVTKAAQ